MTRLDRRELLATFLGLPALLSGCGRETTAALPPGEIVGASHGIGHRIRDGLQADVPEDRWERARVAIVGGGVAGLSAARRLRQAGVDDFVLLELEPEPGGTSRSGSSPVCGYPWGAHYVPAPTRENPELVDLFEELDVFEGEDEQGEPVVKEQFRCRDPQERVFYHGHWYEGLYLHAGAGEEDHRQLQRFRDEIDGWVAWRDGDGRRAFTLPVSRCSDDPHVTALDALSMAEWLDERGFDSKRLRWLVDYSCRDDYGLHTEDTSAWAGLFYFASRRHDPGKPSRPFVTWPEGNGRIVRHLVERAGRRIRSGMAVVDVSPAERDGRSGVDVVAVSAESGAARGFHAERVIFAAPQFLAPYLVRPWREEAPAHSGEFEYGAWLVANLILREHLEDQYPEDFPRAWDNVLYESPSLGYVSASHQRGVDYGPAVLTYYYPLCDTNPAAGRQRLLDVDRDGWAEVALSDLERAHPDVRAKTERLDVMRWGHAMIRPRPGFVWGSARRRAAEPFRGIHFAHSDLSGVALFEEAFDHGNRAADEVLAELENDG